MARFVFPADPVKQVTFSNAQTIEISHDLNYSPLVYIVVNGQLCMANVQYSQTYFTVSLAHSMSGTIFYI